MGYRSRQCNQLLDFYLLSMPTFLVVGVFLNTIKNINKIYSTVNEMKIVQTQLPARCLAGPLEGSGCSCRQLSFYLPATPASKEVGPDLNSTTHRLTFVVPQANNASSVQVACEANSRLRLALFKRRRFDSCSLHRTGPCAQLAS